MGTPIGLLLLGAGVVLVVSAYRNVSPVDVVTHALSGNKSAPRPLGGGTPKAGTSPTPTVPPGGSGPAPGAGGGGGGGSW